jgi:hypothetical protein
MSRVSAAAGLILLLAVSVWMYFYQSSPNFREPAMTIIDARLSQPSDIARFQGRYVVGELYNNRLVIFDDLSLSGLEYFDPRDIGEHFSAPHFLEVTPWNTLLISNGWGGSIVEIEDLQGKGWKEFSGVGKKFRAPHGICVDNEGWIYVGDSLNSRLVRFRDMDGSDWEVFADVEARISYTRELVCRDGVVWVSNSYENRPGLNPGEGSNLLKIVDFSSGRTEVVAEFPDVNATGVLPINDASVVVGLWGLWRRLALVDTRTGSSNRLQRLGIGTPYGTYFDQATGQALVAYFGRLSEEERDQVGGIVVYR